MEEQIKHAARFCMIWKKMEVVISRSSILTNMPRFSTALLSLLKWLSCFHFSWGNLMYYICNFQNGNCVVFVCPFFIAFLAFGNVRIQPKFSLCILVFEWIRPVFSVLVLGAKWTCFFFNRIETFVSNSGKVLYFTSQNNACNLSVYDTLLIIAMLVKCFHICICWMS